MLVSRVIHSLSKEQIHDPRLHFLIKEMPLASLTPGRQRCLGETFSRMKQMELTYLKYTTGNNSQATFHDPAMSEGSAKSNSACVCVCPIQKAVGTRERLVQKNVSSKVCTGSLRKKFQHAASPPLKRQPPLRQPFHTWPGENLQSLRSTF